MVRLGRELDDLDGAGVALRSLVAQQGAEHVADELVAQRRKPAPRVQRDMHGVAALVNDARAMGHEAPALRLLAPSALAPAARVRFSGASTIARISSCCPASFAVFFSFAAVPNAFLIEATISRLHLHASRTTRIWRDEFGE